MSCHCLALLGQASQAHGAGSEATCLVLSWQYVEVRDAVPTVPVPSGGVALW